VSEQLKATRLAAVIKKTMEGVYMQLEASGSAFGVLNRRAWAC